MLGINPAMIGYIVSQELDKILKGEYPEGVICKEKTENKIVLSASEALNFEGIEVKDVNVSIVYKGVEIQLVK